MLKIQKTTASPAETIAFAERLGEKLRAGDVIAYFGGLGVGTGNHKYRRAYLLVP